MFLQIYQTAPDKLLDKDGFFVAIFVWHLLARENS